MSKVRRRLSDDEANLLGLDLLTETKGNPKYRITTGQWETVLKNRKLQVKKETKQSKEKPFVLSAWSEKGYMMSIDEYCDFYKLPRKDITKYKLVSHTGTPFFNIEFKDKHEKAQDEIIGFDFESITKKYIKSRKIKPRVIQTDFDFDTTTYTDIHIAMDTNKDKNSMYAEDWNREEVLKLAQTIVNKTLENKKSNILVLDDLGDVLDGLNAQTTRGGHALPQNMTNEEAFDCGFEFKMLMLDGLAPHYEEVIVNNVCNDNHAGVFAYFLNQYFKGCAELRYNNVSVTNHRTFLSHYIINDIGFVITHGKDDKTLKFGFKPQLDTKQIEKIDQYCKQNNLYNKTKRIIVKKGDSHQLILDMAGSDDFDYYNYPAGSPSSQWVQNNFKKGRRGFVVENFKGLENTITPILIK